MNRSLLPARPFDLPYPSLERTVMCPTGSRKSFLKIIEVPLTEAPLTRCNLLKKDAKC